MTSPVAGENVSRQTWPVPSCGEFGKEGLGCAKEINFLIGIARKRHHSQVRNKPVGHVFLRGQVHQKLSGRSLRANIAAPVSTATGGPAIQARFLKVSIACLSCLLVLLACPACLSCLLVLLACPACLSCLLVLLACPACLSCLLVLLACPACLSCLLVLLACPACLSCLLVLLACPACLSCLLVLLGMARPRTDMRKTQRLQQSADRHLVEIDAEALLDDAAQVDAAPAPAAVAPGWRPWPSPPAAGTPPNSNPPSAPLPLPSMPSPNLALDERKLSPAAKGNLRQSPRVSLYEAWYKDPATRPRLMVPLRYHAPRGEKRDRSSTLVKSLGSTVD